MPPQAESNVAYAVSPAEHGGDSNNNNKSDAIAVDSKTGKFEIPLEGEALEEVCRGMMFASLAITDNKEDTLAKVGKANPWHIEALRLITGSKDQAHRPLSTILDEDMGGMTLDWEMDISKVTKGGQFLDTQGYIAHNDEYIVVSFRCTTSAFDWLTNFNTTSSQWELEEDLEQGFSGFCSGFEGLCCVGAGEYKPRVHTGFYNNFLAALPLIKTHVEPLLGSDQPPRTLYVVGHSLGAGIATLAGCYFLTEFNWRLYPQQLVIVTAGSPRAACQSMKDVVDQKRETFGTENCRMYRIVKGSDVVVGVPPKLFGFRHLIDPIVINDAGDVVIRTDEDDPESDLLQLSQYTNDQSSAMKNFEEDDDDDDDDDNDGKGTGVVKRTSKYDRFVSRIPKAFRDHMPDFYLKPLFRARGVKYGSVRPDVSQASTEEEPDVDEEEGDDAAAAAAAAGDKNEAGERNMTANPSTDTADKSTTSSQRRRRWVPKMFRKKETIQIEPTYF